jgi:hypothetical protein
MKRILIALGALLMLALMTGCPLESSVPLGDPSAGSLDARLAGKWVMKSGSGEEASIVFYPFDANEYYVQLDEKGKPDGTERYRVYTVSVGGEKFLNINKLDEKPGPAAYYFATYTFTKEGALQLRFVDDKNFPKDIGKDQKALVKLISEHLAGDFLYDTSKPDLMVRPQPEPAKTATAKPAAGKPTAAPPKTK